MVMAMLGTLGCGTARATHPIANRHQPEPAVEAEARFREGRALLDAGKLAAAIPVLAKVIALDPEGEYAEYAANRILDACNLRHAYDELGTWAARMQANRPLVAKHPKLASYLRFLTLQLSGRFRTDR
jgi:tetratricopeptide (TPR) repeat protein